MVERTSHIVEKVLLVCSFVVNWASMQRHCLYASGHVFNLCVI